MKTSEFGSGHLLYLTYAAQFDHPMANGVGKVFASLIETKFPFVAPKEFLTYILKLLSIGETLEGMAPSTEGHTDSEIREFLVRLAEEIERRYPNTIRSNNVVNQSGIWQCVEYPEQRGTYQKGEMLPKIDGQCVVWALQTDSPKLEAHEAVLQEFRIYYQTKIIRGAPFASDPKKYADASVVRLLKTLENSEIAKAESLLRSMSEDPKHVITHSIETETLFDWTSDEDNWVWFQKLLIHIADELRTKIK